MIIVFGTRGITTTGARGEFHCPGCREQRTYRHRNVRRWFTLYFIPVIPLNKVGEYVECDHCTATWMPEVLQHDVVAEDKAFEAEFERAIRRVMVMMMMADGVIAEGELETIRKVFGKLTGKDLSEQALLDEAEQVRREAPPIREAVRALVGKLNPSGRELVLKAAFFVAAADGIFQDEEKTLISELAQALQIPSGRFKQILDELLADEPPRPSAGAYG